MRTTPDTLDRDDCHVPPAIVTSLDILYIELWLSGAADSGENHSTYAR